MFTDNRGHGGNTPRFDCHGTAEHDAGQQKILILGCDHLNGVVVGRKGT